MAMDENKKTLTQREAIIEISHAGSQLAQAVQKLCQIVREQSTKIAELEQKVQLLQIQMDRK